MSHASDTVATSTRLLDEVISMDEEHPNLYIPKLNVPRAFKSLFFSDVDNDSTTSAIHGSIKDKINLYEGIETDWDALRYIADVHRKGLEKYKPYSWLVDPEHTDGTPELCLRAAMRHIAAYDMGCVLDIEGLPHLHHYICRLGMAAVASIRELEHQKYIRNFADSICHQDLKAQYDTYTQDDLWYHFILPEHLIALAIGRFNADKVPFVLGNQFAMCLYTYNKYKTSKLGPHGEVYTNVDQIDPTAAMEAMCYVCTCFAYGCKYVQQYKLPSYTEVAM